LPPARPAPGGVLTVRQTRMRTARRALAAAGYAEAVTWSFMKRAAAERFGGGAPELVLSNPIAADLDCMRPSILPNLIEAVGRNARRGYPDAALFEIGPVYRGDQPQDQAAVIAAVLAPHPSRRWDGRDEDALFTLKGDLEALLAELSAPALQTVQGQSAPWWSPGRSARLQLGPKTVVAEFGEIHPAVLKALDVDGPVLGFELHLDLVPEPKRREVKTRQAFQPSTLMPLSRDFAFLLPEGTPAGDLVRPVLTADKALITEARIFDVYQGPGVPEGFKSVAVEVRIQPREQTLAEADIEALSARIVAAAGKACGARLRS
ncbi:MAG: phenylalanine--tRNA ligase subunit beta, partial [Phenylobacterium sp.]